MPSPPSRVRRDAFLAASLAVLSACAGFREAHGERMGVQRGVTPEVRLVAEHGASGSNRPAAEPVTRGVLGLEVVPVLGERPAVGALFDRNALAGQEATIVVGGESPDETLRRDVASELRAQGFDVREQPADVPPGADRVVVGWVQLGARSIPARWYQLRGRVEGRAAFEARLLRGEEILWQRRFEGTATRRVAYFSSSDSEAVLGQAYGRALADLAAAFTAAGAAGAEP